MAANAVVLVIGGYQISIAKYLRGYLPSYKIERDRLNIVRVRVFTSSGTTGGRGGGDAKTIISPNTSFGDITTRLRVLSDTKLYHTEHFYLEYLPSLFIRWPKSNFSPVHINIIIQYLAALSQKIHQLDLLDLWISSRYHKLSLLKKKSYLITMVIFHNIVITFLMYLAKLLFFSIWFYRPLLLVPKITVLSIVSLIYPIFTPSYIYLALFTIIYPYLVMKFRATGH